MTSSITSMRSAAGGGREIIMPSAARAALGRVVDRQAGPANIAELVVCIGKIFRAKGRVTQPNHAPRRDASAGRCNQDCSRPGRELCVCRSLPEDRIVIAMCLKTDQTQRPFVCARCLLLTRKSSEPESLWRYRKPKLVREQRKSRFYSQNVGSGEPRRSGIPSQCMPNHLARIAGEDDFEAALPGVTKPADPACHSGNVYLRVTEIWERAQLRRRSERG